MYYELQQTVHDLCPTVIPMFTDQVMGASKKIRYPTPLNGNFVFDGYRFAERWWMA